MTDDDFDIVADALRVLVWGLTVIFVVAAFVGGMLT